MILAVYTAPAVLEQIKAQQAAYPALWSKLTHIFSGRVDFFSGAARNY